MNEALILFLAATIRTTTPLALAAFGELLVERAGMINIGLEGAIIAGAFGALVGATTGGVWAGYCGALTAGMLIAAIYALFVIRLRTDQIITGTALTLLSLGLTGTLYRAMFGTTGAALNVPTSAPYAIPGLAAIPVVGQALWNQPPVTYATYALVPLLWWYFGNTHAGLALRAIGERPEAATVAGVHVQRVRTLAVLAGGGLGGIAGGTLVLAQAGTFVEGMSAGRGFIAIAIVVLGRWHPLGVALACIALWRGQCHAVRVSGHGLACAVSTIPRHALYAYARRPRRRSWPSACTSGPRQVVAMSGVSYTAPGH